MDVRLPDGRILRGVPEGTSKEEIAAKLGMTVEELDTPASEDVPSVPAVTPSAVPPRGPEGFSARQMAMNLPGSMVNLAVDMAQPFINPVDTLSALGNTILGAASKMVGADLPAEASAEAVGRYYADRYGGIEQALQTLQNDPAGFLSDLTMVGSPLAKVGQMPRVARAVEAMDPVNALINVPAAAASRMVSPDRPATMYQSAAKIPRTQRRSQRRVDEQVQTALRENIPPTNRGLERLDVTVNELDNEITSAIARADTAGKTAPKDSLFRYLGEVRREFGGPTNVNAAQDLAAIDNVVGEYNRHLEQMGVTNLSPMELQTLKRNTYKQIDFDRSQLQANKAAEEARKAIARAAKENIERLVPDADIKALNAREGALLDLRPSLEQAASRIERGDAVGIGLPIKALTGEAVGGPMGFMAGALAGLADAPKPKAGMALSLHQMRQQPLLETLTRSRYAPNLRRGLMEAGQLYEVQQGLLAPQLEPEDYGVGLLSPTSRY